MKYVSGIFALNLMCSLETCGDWHQSSLAWNRVYFRDTAESVFGDYGIELQTLPAYLVQYFDGPVVHVANHIRACLDLLEIGKFTVVEGMREDFICVTQYDNEIFEHVLLLRQSKNWKRIDEFMINEYFGKWNKFKESHHA